MRRCDAGVDSPLARHRRSSIPLMQNSNTTPFYLGRQRVVVAWRTGPLRFAALFVLGCGSAAPQDGKPSENVVAPTRAADSSGDLVFTINTVNRFPISRFIYGGSFVTDGANYGGVNPPDVFTLNRMGGNRLTAYNWETNYSNAGNDYQYQNDQYLSLSKTPGQAVRDRAAPSFSRNQAFLATIPMLGYVASDNCVCNVGTSDYNREQRLAQHFNVSRATRGVPPGGSPDLGDRTVYQDEFVRWFEGAFPGRASHPTAPVFFALDNEPDIWHSTHKEIASDIDDDDKAPRLVTYGGLIDTSIAYARAVKAVLPSTLIFGPGVATYAGVATAGRYPSPDPTFGRANFYDVYLDRMRAAEAVHGKRLLDVLDTHWYPAISTRGGEITNDFAAQDSATVWARVQAPRSLWDATFDEQSWVSGVTNGPVRLIPRLKAQIAAHYPGTKIAFSEYYYGRGGDISGGIAQADVLGIFGREGVFAAMLWPQVNVWAPPWRGDGSRAYAYLFGAFKMYRNYDGAGGRFGDVGLSVTNSNMINSSVYASQDSSGRFVVVAINKTTTPKLARFVFSGITTVTGIAAYTMRDGQPNPVRESDPAVPAQNEFTYTLPAMSVSTLVVRH
jgi:hypothetical protein